MPIPEVPIGVMAATDDMDRVDAVKHAWSQAWQDCVSHYEQDIHRIVDNARREGLKVVAVEAVHLIGVRRADS